MKGRDSIRGTLAVAAVLLSAFAVAAWHVTAGLQAWTFEDVRRSQVAEGTRRAAPVTLEDSDGRRFRPWANGQADAAIYLVDFIYTDCESVCSALGATYTQMQAQIGARAGREQPRVRLLSISFDPADAQAALARYAARHRRDPALWSVTRVASDTERAALLEAIGIVARPDGRGGFLHNSAIHLVDGRGRVVAVYDYEEWPAALAAAFERGAS